MYGHYKYIRYIVSERHCDIDPDKSLAVSSFGGRGINDIDNNASYDCVLSLLYGPYWRLFIITLLSFLEIGKIS